MGGQGSDMFEYFKILILQGLVAARKHSDKITTLVDVMRAGNYFFILKNIFSVKMIYIPILMIYRITVTLFYKQFSNRPKYETTFPFEFDRRSASCFGGYNGRTINSLSHYQVVRWLPVFDQWDTVIWLLKYD